jgi:hypothetical protein
MENEMRKKIGALWTKMGSHGVFYSGEVIINGEAEKVVAFINRDKKNPNQPDIDILLTEENRYVKPEIKPNNETLGDADTDKLLSDIPF